MEISKFLNELIGKSVLIIVQDGPGNVPDSIIAGQYKGILIEYDGRFVKLEYDVSTFANGKGYTHKEDVLINADYIITAIQEWVADKPPEEPPKQS